MIGAPELGERFGLADAVKCDNVALNGSPNRTVTRFALEAAGRRFIAEGFAASKQVKQARQLAALEFFQARGLPGIHPFLRTPDGAPGVADEKLFWQLRPYVDCDPLPREQLGVEADFARIWGDFLLALKRVGEDPAVPELPNDRFFFAGYIPTLRDFVGRKLPEFQADLAEICEQLHPFLRLEFDYPAMLAHGDFHPGNLLLAHGEISAVIDWEFLGRKSAGYDLALLIGCLGMDDPAWLTGVTVRSLIHRLREADYLPEIAWEHLPELVVATRLGWLGEWVDLGERDLAAQEIALIRRILAEDPLKIS